MHAETVIPWGATMISKAGPYIPRDVCPMYAKHGQGGRFFDLDGNEFIDFNAALLAVNLGYGDPDVNAAVARQLQDGNLFSLSHTLEAEVAQLVTEMVPCAEMVMYGKNGSDVTSMAVRLARAITGRDHIACSSYHAWHDWYAGTTPLNQGVPRAVQELTHTFTYNSIESLHTLFRSYPGQIALVIMEPYTMELPRPGFLEEVQALTRANGALLCFDEVVTGFRLAIGGGQEAFGVTPDLACFGKALANGFPLTLLAGKQEYLQQLTGCLVAMTYAGELLALAAARATLEKIRREPVLQRIHQQGGRLLTAVKGTLERCVAAGAVTLGAHPALPMLRLNGGCGCTDGALRTLLMQEMADRGIFNSGLNSITYAHTDEDVDRLIQAYSEIAPLLEDALEKGDVSHLLRTAPLSLPFVPRKVALHGREGR